MSDFRDLLRRSGLTKAQLAKHLELHQNTVTNWGNDAPGYALAYLRLYVRIKEVAAEAKRGPQT